MALSAGEILGPYEIVAPLGAGGMGEVYKARDTRLDRTVAIKVLPEHLAKWEDLRARFEPEARAVASLNNPNICTSYGIGSQDGVGGFMVMWRRSKANPSRRAHRERRNTPRPGAAVLYAASQARISLPLASHKQ